MREGGKAFHRKRPFVKKDGLFIRKENICQEGGVRRGRRTFIRREGPFIEVEECSSKEGASVWGGERSSRECSFVKKGAVRRGRMFAKRGAVRRGRRTFVARGASHRGRGEAIRCERRTFINRGGHSSREGMLAKRRGHLSRQATVRQGRGPFVKEGDCRLLREDRKPFVKGRTSHRGRSRGRGKPKERGYHS